MAQVLIIAILFGVFNLTAADRVASTVKPEQASWVVLEHELAHGSLDHKLQTLAALATIPGTDDRAVKLVETALRDPGTQVRQAACLALGQMKAAQAAPALKQALGDTGEVSFAAAKALADIGDPSGQETLIAVLAGDRKDTPGILTNAIRAARRKLHHPEGLVLMGAQDAAGSFPPIGTGIDMGMMAGKDALDLKSKGTPGRVAAAEYLAKDPGPYAVKLLEWALSDGNQFVRMEAARGLGERGNAESVPKLQYLLTDPHTRVKAMAAASIVRITSGETKGAAEATRSAQPN